jgi:hypothetical protein
VPELLDEPGREIERRRGVGREATPARPGAVDEQERIHIERPPRALEEGIGRAPPPGQEGVQRRVLRNGARGARQLGGLLLHLHHRRSGLLIEDSLGGGALVGAQHPQAHPERQRERQGEDQGHEGEGA